VARTITRLALRTKIRLDGELGDDDSLYWTSAMLNDWINSSWAMLFDLLATADPERYIEAGNISVVSGTASYNLPSDFHREHALWFPDSSADSGYIKAPRISPNELFTVGDAGAEVGETFYYTRNGKVYLHPSPGWTGTAILQYIAVPDSLTDDSHTIDSVNLWTEWLVEDVLEKASLREKDLELAKAHAKRRDSAGALIFVRPETNQAAPGRVVNMRV
jgi:hypothetical protein